MLTCIDCILYSSCSGDVHIDAMAKQGQRLLNSSMPNFLLIFMHSMYMIASLIHTLYAPHQVMEFLFSIMSAFVDVNTKKKFHMLSSANSVSKLLEYVAWSELPARYIYAGCNRMLHIQSCFHETMRYPTVCSTPEGSVWSQLPTIWHHRSHVSAYLSRFASWLHASTDSTPTAWHMHANTLTQSLRCPNPI